MPSSSVLGGSGAAYKQTNKQVGNKPNEIDRHSHLPKYNGTREESFYSLYSALRRHLLNVMFTRELTKITEGKLLTSALVSSGGLIGSPSASGLASGAPPSPGSSSDLATKN